MPVLLSNRFQKLKHVEAQLHLLSAAERHVEQQLEIGLVEPRAVGRIARHDLADVVREADAVHVVDQVLIRAVLEYHLVGARRDVELIVRRRVSALTSRLKLADHGRPFWPW